MRDYKFEFTVQISSNKPSRMLAVTCRKRDFNSLESLDREPDA